MVQSDWYSIGGMDGKCLPVNRKKGGQGPFDRSPQFDVNGYSEVCILISLENTAEPKDLTMNLGGFSYQIVVRSYAYILPKVIVKLIKIIHFMTLDKMTQEGQWRLFLANGYFTTHD